MFRNGRVGGKCCLDIGVELVLIQYCGCAKCWSGENGCLERCCNLFMNKDWTEIIRVHWSIAIISLFWIDVLLSSECIQFGAKTSRAEMNYKIELGEVFQLSCLLAYQNLGHREILQVLVIRYNVDWWSGTFQIVLPNFEDFEYCK